MELHPDLFDIEHKCRDCGVCVNQCLFLKKYGSPIEILQDSDRLINSYNCTLCGLCSNICPYGLDPTAMFMTLRRISLEKGHNLNLTHKSFLNFESIGYSKALTWYEIPQNCTSVFFPGCNFTGTRPKTTEKIYTELKKKDNTTGIIFDCCGIPSYSLGLFEHQKKRFSETIDLLKQKGINKVFFACPNCYKIFKDYALDLNLVMVFSVFLDNKLDPCYNDSKITIHDPCVLRNEKKIHKDIRSFFLDTCIDFMESENSGLNTICCGGGGGLGCFSPKSQKKWSDKIKEKSNGYKIVTYCAGCQDNLGDNSYHILDLLFFRKKDIKVTKSPFTYLKRYLLKRKFKKSALKSSLTAERINNQLERTDKI